jgi:dTDP-L-rhamnose 4-epimerase
VSNCVRRVIPGEQVFAGEVSHRMTQRILITGGAGFIGSHVADELLEAGYVVRVLDILSPQVHGPEAVRPTYLHKDIELIIGDVRDREMMNKALRGVDAVFHFAAMVGVAQSMYEIDRYTSVNNFGTAVFLQSLIDHPVERLIVASSMSVYGEGLYRAGDGGVANGVERGLQQLRRREWELRDQSGEVLQPMPTPESKHPSLASVYALSKYDQERMCLLFGRAYRIPTVALRFFNVYGTRQALSNPYTGVLAIFASRLLNNNPPIIFEDGLQRRDFVSVKDVAQACRLALERTDVQDEVFNVGCGSSYTVREIADRMAIVLDCQHLTPQLTNDYRMGDIRHCFADISLARQRLGYEPRVTLERGIEQLSDWLASQVATDRVGEHQADLRTRGLTI